MLTRFIKARGRYSVADAVLDVLTSPDILQLSLDKLATRWGWPSKSKVFEFLTELQKNQVIDREKISAKKRMDTLSPVLADYFARATGCDKTGLSEARAEIAAAKKELAEIKKQLESGRKKVKVKKEHEQVIAAMYPRKKPTHRQIDNPFKSQDPEDTFCIAWGRWVEHMYLQHSDENRNEDAEKLRIMNIYQLADGKLDVAIRAINFSIRRRYKEIFLEKDNHYGDVKFNTDGNSRQYSEEPFRKEPF